MLYGIFPICPHIYTVHHLSRDNTNKALNSCLSKFTIYMLFEDTDTEESVSSLSDVSSLESGMSKMQFESSNSEEQVTDDDADLQVWGETESESDAEFLEDHGMVEEVQANSEDSCQRSLCSRFLSFLMRVSLFKNVMTDNILSCALRISLPLSSWMRRSMFLSGGQSSFFVALGYRVFSSSRIHSIQCSFSLPPQTGIRSFSERAHNGTKQPHAVFLRVSTKKHWSLPSSEVYKMITSGNNSCRRT